MPYRYRLLSSALRELEHEIAYSEERWGKRHASRYRRALFAVIKRITANPYSYPARGGGASGESEFRVVRYKGNYITYLINEAEICVEIVGFPSIHYISRNKEGY